MSQNTKIPFHVPSINDKEIEAITNVLDSGWLTTGKITKEFEKYFAQFVGAKYASAVSSATAGLFLSLKAIGINDESTVITTPYTFVSTAEVVEWIGADLMFVDVEDDYNISAKKILHSYNVGVDIDAIIPVHIGGYEFDLSKISNLNIPIIEDSAHNLPSIFSEQSKTAVFSFYATKSLTTGEGGMVVTNDEEIYKNIESLKFHGISTNAWNRYTDNKWYYEVDKLGYKFNLTDLASAIGIQQLSKQFLFASQRRNIANRYLNELYNVKAINFPKHYLSELANNNWHLFMIQVDPKDRDKIFQKLTDKGIGASVHFIPLHMMPYYRNKYNYSPEDFPKAKELFEKSISIPIYPDMTEEQINYVIYTLTNI